MEEAGLRINLVLPHQFPFPPLRGGGVESLNWMLAKEFSKLGHQVTAYSRAVPELPAHETDSSGVRHIRIKGYDRRANRWVDHFYGLLYAQTLWNCLEPADVTSFHTPFSFLLRLKDGLGACTHTIHRTPKWPVPYYRGLDRVYCGSDAVVRQAMAISPGMRNLKRVYNCIDLPSEAPAVETRERTGLTFLYVGRFVPDKGIASLVFGFERALNEFPENRLMTVGPQESSGGADSRFFRVMSRYLKDRSLTSKVEFLPPVFDKERLNALIASADVICVPSLSGETFSMAILEAMALAKPVLVSDFCPMPEAVDHEITGYVAKLGDADSIAAGIRFFSENAGRLREFGLAGFRKASEFFSVQRIAREYLADFVELQSRRSGKAVPETVEPLRQR